MSRPFKYLLIIFTLALLTVWLAVFTFPSKKLKLITCDVGQGDASLVTYGKTQILIDGGPDNKVMDCLNEYLPFWDRTIELVVLSHPEADHFTGLIDVFNNYQVLNFLPAIVENSSKEYQVLKSEVGGQAVRVIEPVEGTSIRLGLIHLDVVHPLTDEKNRLLADSAGIPIGNAAAKSNLGELNQYSTVAVLRLGEFKALFPGDLPADEFKQLLLLNKIPQVDYIKIAHHGSKSSLSEDLLKTAEPDVTVISVGKDNRYGHPNKEVLDALLKDKIKYFRTDEIGDVVIEAEGNKMQLLKYN